MKPCAYPVVAAVALAALVLMPRLQAQPLASIETVAVGDAGNFSDTNGFGAVAYYYRIGKTEVTIGQYAAFLNAVATTSTNAHLWNSNMASDANIAGIQRLGSGTSEDPFSYETFGSVNRPVTYVSLIDGARFANWMHNGATNGASTEDGAYTLNVPLVSNRLMRNPTAKWWVPTEDEWYKAAYFKGGGSNAGYWVYPTQSDTSPGNMLGAGVNQANYKADGLYTLTRTSSWSTNQNYLTDAGTFSNSSSAYGALDLAGNVAEWVDGIMTNSLGNSFYIVRGGSWASTSNELRPAARPSSTPGESRVIGFRLAGLEALPSEGPRIHAAVKGESGFSLSWSGGSSFMHVQRRALLSDGAWKTIASNNATGIFLDGAPPADRAFYRLLAP